MTIEIYREWARGGAVRVKTDCEWARGGGVRVKQTVGDGNNELQMGKGWASE